MGISGGLHLDRFRFRPKKLAKCVRCGAARRGMPRKEASPPRAASRGGKARPVGRRDAGSCRARGGRDAGPGQGDDVAATAHGSNEALPNPVAPRYAFFRPVVWWMWSKGVLLGGHHRRRMDGRTDGRTGGREMCSDGHIEEARLVQPEPARSTSTHIGKRRPELAPGGGSVSRPHPRGAPEQLRVSSFGDRRLDVLVPVRTA